MSIYPNCILAEESLIRVIRGQLSERLLNLFFLERRPEFTTLVLLLFFRTLKTDTQKRLAFFATHSPSGFDYKELPFLREIEKLELLMAETLWPLYERIRKEESFPDWDIFETDPAALTFEEIGNAIVWVVQYVAEETTSASPHVLATWDEDPTVEPWKKTVARFVEQTRRAIVAFSANALPHYIRLAIRIDYLTQRNIEFVKTAVLSSSSLAELFPMVNEPVIFDVFAFDERLGLIQAREASLDLKTVDILFDRIPVVSTFIDQYYIVHASYSWSQRGIGDFILDFDRPSFGALCPLLCYPIIEDAIGAIVASGSAKLEGQSDSNRPSCFLEPCKRLTHLWNQNIDPIANKIWPPQFSLAETWSSFEESPECCVLTQNLLPTKLAACARRLTQICTIPPPSSAGAEAGKSDSSTLVQLLGQVFDIYWAESKQHPQGTRYNDIITCLLDRNLLIPPAKGPSQATLQFLNIYTIDVTYVLRLPAMPDNETRFRFIPAVTEEPASHLATPPAAPVAPSPPVTQPTQRPITRKGPYPPSYFQKNGPIEHERVDEEDEAEEADDDDDMDGEYSQPAPESNRRSGKGKGLPRGGKGTNAYKPSEAKVTSTTATEKTNKGRKFSLGSSAGATAAATIAPASTVPPKKRKRVEDPPAVASVSTATVSTNGGIDSLQPSADNTVLEILSAPKRRKLEQSLLDTASKWGTTPSSPSNSSARTRPRRR